MIELWLYAATPPQSRCTNLQRGIRFTCEAFIEAIENQYA